MASPYPLRLFFSSADLLTSESILAASTVHFTFPHRHKGSFANISNPPASHIKRDISEFTLMFGAALTRDDRRFPSVLRESEGIAWTAAVEHKQESSKGFPSQNTPGENLKCPDNSPNKSPWQRILRRYVMKESIQREKENSPIHSRTFLLKIMAWSEDKKKNVLMKQLNANSCLSFVHAGCPLN